MPTELPDPMTPADCDLRDFPFMQLDVARLRDSELAAVEDAEIFRVSVLSWCVAWHQIPAASLPDDDRALARMLGFGRDVPGFVALREAGALHGWVRCSDGRLYHPVVAKKANEAWDHKTKQRERGKAGAAKRWHGDGGTNGGGNAPSKEPPSPKHGGASGVANATANSASNATAIATPMLADSKGEGEGEREGYTPLSGGPGGERIKRATRLPDPWPLTPERRAAAAKARATGQLPPVNLDLEHAKFCDHWHSKGGQNATKVDWERAWLNWARNANVTRTTNVRSLPALSLNKNQLAG